MKFTISILYKDGFYPIETNFEARYLKITDKSIMAFNDEVMVFYADMKEVVDYDIK